MKKRYAAVFLLVFLAFLTACADPSEEIRERPEITITVVSGKYPYAPAELLLDDGFRSALEDRLEVSILLETVQDIGPFDEAVDITFTGGLITDNCYWMIPMGSGYRLEKMEEAKGVLEPQYGRLGSTAYSYVFSDPYNADTEPVLVVNLELLKEVEATSVPYTEEGVYKMLTDLSNHCDVPLAVYGNPAGEGFGCLLSLFQLAPTGGREYNLENDEICFDKISDTAKRYLAFSKQLRDEGMIPSECVSMNEYSSRELFLNGTAALAMFPNVVSAREAVERAREQGIDAVIVKIPGIPGKLWTDTYNRPIGLISYDYAYSRELLQIYEALQEQIITLILPEKEGEEYQLFCYVGKPAVADPLEELLPEIGILYKKHLLDRKVIEPYYARLITGSLPLESGFSELREEWMNVYAQEGASPAELSGANLMQIINGWYYKNQKEK